MSKYAGPFGGGWVAEKAGSTCPVFQVVTIGFLVNLFTGEQDDNSLALPGWMAGSSSLRRVGIEDLGSGFFIGPGAGLIAE